MTILQEASFRLQSSMNFLMSVSSCGILDYLLGCNAQLDKEDWSIENIIILTQRVCGRAESKNYSLFTDFSHVLMCG